MSTVGGGQAGEEIGWRGYALLVTALSVAIPWALSSFAAGTPCIMAVALTSIESWRIGRVR
jgi:hypothetical protein